MRKYKFMDPEMIMTVVVSLIILGVGVFAFFTVVVETDTEMKGVKGVSAPSATTSNANNQTWYQILNTTNNMSGTGNSVFNIVGIVLVIGAIMTIVGLVYSYVRPGY